MEHLTLRMVRPDLENLTNYPLPVGYHFRFYQPGDEVFWAEIEYSVGDFETIEKALDMYHHDFGTNTEELRKRQLFLCTDSGEVIGTITAWSTERYTPGVNGLIHWVAIKPDYQAKKLGRPLIYAALELMRTWHTDAFLCTSTHRLRAVRVYLDLGFIPYIREENDKAAWELAAKSIDHPVLKEYM